jgi:uncharacterized Fe-S cluster protein YjdI/CDGSH-type Zn-finger protein
MLKEYRTDRIVVRWEPRLCIHSGRCTSALPMVFDRNARPWIDPSNADPDAVANVVARCPSGALHYERLDGGAQEPPPQTYTVEPQPNGPLYVTGPIRIVDADGNLIREDVRVALCRCGASRNKPFCDGTHEDVGFRTEETP